MFYKSLDYKANTKDATRVFLGYNHTNQPADGEFYDMRNMSADEYPAVATRKRRTKKLTLASNDWQELETEFAFSYDGSVSSGTVVYQSGSMEVGGKETLSFSCTADEELVSSVGTEVTYYDPEGKEIGTETVGKDPFVTPDQTGSCKIVVSATVRNPQEQEEEDLIGCVTGMSVKLFNRNIRGMLLKDGKLAYMVGSRLMYDGTEVDFKEHMPESDDYRTEVQLLSFGVYILIFPLALYFNTRDPKDYGMLSEEYVAGKQESQVKFTMCDANGEEITASTEEPENPENMDYWLDTEEKCLYQWSESLAMWVSVSATYIRIEIAYEELPENPFPQMFAEGDAVFMNSSLEDINKGSIIQKLGQVTGEDGKVTGGYIVVKGYLSGQIVEEVSSEKTLYFRRKVPEMDYVCVSNNRVWGCRHGISEDSEAVNEIYASKLGDAKNWYCYAGNATDSYALSLGDDGEFTAAFTFKGYPMFFKENVVYKIYGGYPAAYQLYTYDCRGVQKGSHRSLAVVNEYLVYKSVRDVCVFDGSTPAGISGKLGAERYHSAAAGACLGKYYISMEDSKGETCFFTYDLERGIWCREDGLKIEEFAYNNSGQLYGRNKLSVYGFEEAEDTFGQTEETPEGKLEWMLETPDLGLTSSERLWVRAIHVRVYMEYAAVMDVYLDCGSTGDRPVKTVRGEGRICSFRIPVIAARTDHFRIRLSGYGYVRVYSMEKEMEYGSDRK